MGQADHPEVIMNDDLAQKTARELLVELAAIEESIRSTATFDHKGTDAEHQPINEHLIVLAEQEQRVISELRRRDNVVTPTAVWSAEQTPV
jgi:hypothetical protein